MRSWIILHKTKHYTEAAIIQSMLAAHQIPVQVLNKQDSSYVNFGNMHVFVPASYVSLANELLLQIPQALPQQPK